jgi:hypothetical protein
VPGESPVAETCCGAPSEFRAQGEGRDGEFPARVWIGIHEEGKFSAENRTDSPFRVRILPRNQLKNKEPLANLTFDRFAFMGSVVYVDFKTA